MLEGVKKKVGNAKALDKKLYTEAKSGIKLRIHEYRSDPMLIALVAIEVILILLLIFALFFLFDPNMEFELGAPFVALIPWEMKLVLFVVTVFFIWKLYSYTEWYRKDSKLNRKF